MCNLYSITINQAAMIALFRVVNRYVGNLAPIALKSGSEAAIDWDEDKREVNLTDPYLWFYLRW